MLQAGGSNALHDADTYSTHDACDGEMAVSGGVFLQRMHVCGSTFVLVPLPSGEANAIVKREHVDGQIRKISIIDDKARVSLSTAMQSSMHRDRTCVHASATCES